MPEVFEQEHTVETDYRGTTTEKGTDTMAGVVDSESARTAATRRRTHAAAAG
jgi:hypothetical protein